MYSPKLDEALERLNYLKGPVLPKLERAAIRHNKIINSERFRRLIELRDAGADKEVVRHLNLFTNRMLDYESCCAEAKKIIRLTFHQAGGLFDSRAGGIERAVVGG